METYSMQRLLEGLLPEQSNRSIFAWLQPLSSQSHCLHGPYGSFHQKQSFVETAMSLIALSNPQKFTRYGNSQFFFTPAVVAVFVEGYPAQPQPDSSQALKEASPKEVVKEEVEEERLCRYCFEGDEAGELISPCRCSGGQKYVHLSCLRMWQRAVLVSQPTHPDLYDHDTRQRICNVCKTEFTCLPPTRAELLASFTGPELAALIEERCFIGSAENFSRELERQVASFPGIMREGIVCLNWIRGLFLIVKVVEDRHRGIVLLRISDDEELGMFMQHLEADARTGCCSCCLPYKLKTTLPFRPSRDRPKLPSLETPLSAREARKVPKPDQSRFNAREPVKAKGIEHADLEAGYPVLPSALGAALGNPVSLLALEDWHKTHSGIPEERGFESKLLACEARFRKIERLTARLDLPDTAVTAVVVDLLRDVVETLPAPIQKIAAEVLQHVENAIYSNADNERLPAAEQAQLAEVLGRVRPGRADLSELQPWFQVVRRQQATLERMEQHVSEMQGVVDFHLARRKSVLDFIVRLQGQERFILQQWLFNFWVFSYRERKSRMEKMSQSVLATGDDMVTPFLSWRLYVAQQRLVRAKEKCSEVDRQASVLANKITEVEMENQEQQRILEESLAAGAELKEKCMVEQQELSRLKQIWSDTQPELLLQVLAQSLEVFFSLVVRQAGLHHLEVKHRLAKKDIRPLLEEPEDPSAENEMAEAILLRWINSTLAQARLHCEELLDDMTKVENPDALILVARKEDIENMETDLSDCIALTALYAMIKAERERKGFSEQDLIALNEVDKDLRSVQLCYCLLEISPTERAKSLLVPHEIAEGDTEKLQTFLAAVFALHPMLQDLPLAMNNIQAWKVYPATGLLHR
eukprot:symbB.v1.2.040056.t1/scaffold6960.1/size14222/1